MKETTHYKLKKYEDADYADPSLGMNPNMDAIDAALQALEDGKASLGEGGTIPAEQLPDLDYEAPLKDNAAKETPADGDSLPLVDSADGGKTKRLLWSRIKAVLQAYFDPLYAAAAHSHAWSTITGKPAGYAPSSHAATHGSSGTDPVTPAAIGAAASAHKHGAGDINSGTLDAARIPGLPASKITSGTLPLTRGGTGAATAAAARTNLGAASTAAYTAATTVEGWAHDSTNGWYSQTVSVSGMLASDAPIVDVVLTGDADADLLICDAYARLTRVVAATNSVTLYCYESAPTVAFTFKLKVVR